jgi:hypothetical protein
MRIGAIARVIGVGMGLEAEGLRPGVYLILREYPVPAGLAGWNARNFRKLEAAEDCFVRAMREMQPVGPCLEACPTEKAG